MRPPPRSTLFPYTTLFRSVLHHTDGLRQMEKHARGLDGNERKMHAVIEVPQAAFERGRAAPDAPLGKFLKRSEEHTSELQSHSDLVCRLLLEKKKKKRKQE